MIAAGRDKVDAACRGLPVGQQAECSEQMRRCEAHRPDFEAQPYQSEVCQKKSLLIRRVDQCRLIPRLFAQCPASAPAAGGADPCTKKMPQTIDINGTKVKVTSRAQCVSWMKRKQVLEKGKAPTKPAGSPSPKQPVPAPAAGDATSCRDLPQAIDINGTKVKVTSFAQCMSWMKRKEAIEKKSRPGAVAPKPAAPKPAADRPAPAAKPAAANRPEPAAVPPVVPKGDEKLAEMVRLQEEQARIDAERLSPRRGSADTMPMHMGEIEVSKPDDALTPMAGLHRMDLGGGMDAEAPIPAGPPSKILQRFLDRVLKDYPDQVNALARMAKDGGVKKSFTMSIHIRFERDTFAEWDRLIKLADNSQLDAAGERRLDALNDKLPTKAIVRLSTKSKDGGAAITGDGLTPALADKLQAKIGEKVLTLPVTPQESEAIFILKVAGGDMPMQQRLFYREVSTTKTIFW